MSRYKGIAPTAPVNGYVFLMINAIQNVIGPQCKQFIALHGCGELSQMIEIAGAGILAGVIPAAADRRRPPFSDTRQCR